MSSWPTDIMGRTDTIYEKGVGLLCVVLGTYEQTPPKEGGAVSL